MDNSVTRRPIFSIGPDMTVRRRRFNDLFTVRDNRITLTFRGMRYPVTPRQHRAITEQFENELAEVTAKFRRFFLSTFITSLIAIPAWFGLQDWLLTFLPATARRFADGFILLQPLIWAGALGVTQELRISAMIERLVKDASNRIDYVEDKVGPSVEWGSVLLQVAALAGFSAMLFGFLLR